MIHLVRLNVEKIVATERQASLLEAAGFVRTGGKPAEAEAKAEKPVDQMTKAELLEKAAGMGIEVPDGATKPMIAALIAGA